MDCSPPDFYVHGILQARILEWVAIPFSRGVSPTQGLNPGLPHCRQILYHLSRWGFLIYFKKYVTYWGYSQFSHYTYCKYFSTLSSTFHFVSFTHINCDLNHHLFLLLVMCLENVSSFWDQIYFHLYFPESTIFNDVLRNTHNKKLRKCSTQMLRLSELHLICVYTPYTQCVYKAKSKSNKTDFICWDATKLRKNCGLMSRRQ